MTAAENKACGKEAGEVLGWKTSSPTSLVVDSLASWGDKEADQGTEGEGGARTWSIHSSRSNVLIFHSTDEFELLTASKYFSFHRVSLEDLYNGKTTKLQLSKNVLCSSCNG